MKKLMYLLLLLCIMTSCDAYDTYSCYQSVKKEYPNALSIELLPNSKYKFLVVDNDSTIWFVETLNQTDAKISDTVKLYSFGK